MKLTILAVAASILVSGCLRYDTSIGEFDTTVTKAPVNHKKQNFIEMVDFMHEHKHITNPTENQKMQLYSYLAASGLHRDCNKKTRKCVLKYEGNSVIIDPKYIEIKSKTQYARFDNVRDAANYLYY
jgi:hypothetical protein